MAVIASVFGEILVMVLKILISTKKNVIRSAIQLQPSTTSGGMRKITQDTTTKRLRPNSPTEERENDKIID